MRNTVIRMHANDNVAVAVRDLSVGEEALPGLRALQGIPQAHKIALGDIREGDAIVRYGVHIGYALRDIQAGGWVNEHSLRLPVPPDLDELRCGVHMTEHLPKAPVTTFEGYPNPWGGPAGTRNLLGISTTVQCVTSVLNVAVRRIRDELLPRFPNVDGVVPINHAYGCGVAIGAPDADIPIRTLRNLVRHPNFGGEVMAIGLGCEKLTAGMLLEEEDFKPDNLIMLQEIRGFEAMVAAIMRMAEHKLARLNARKRTTLPLSDLLIGMQCGGSDAFSGITANPAAGYAADMLVGAGATVLFSEATEVRDGAHLLMERCAGEDTCAKLAREMRWYDDYLMRGGANRSANTTPGNKKGGLSNIVEKAMGSIAKSGTAPIVEVLSPGEKPTRRGMIYANTSASDFVCGTSQLASGITLQVFMTGRGTPYGLAMAPVIKVSSRDELKAQWPDLIDLSAGAIATGEKTIPEIGTELFRMIISVANGQENTWAEKHGLHNDLCVFNPAPIT